MEKGGFDHEQWPTPLLLIRLAEIALYLDSVKLTQTEILELDHESECLSFELRFRDVLS